MHMPGFNNYSCNFCSFTTFVSRFVDNKQWGLAISEKSRLPDSLRWRVVVWMEMGLSQDDATKRLNVSRSVIHRLWNQYQTEASVSRRHVSSI
ncbi:paired domain-containing protein [Trichonephila clavipes]|nr:paired domain-containing protein [Trichonephila clavipes]